MYVGSITSGFKVVKSFLYNMQIAKLTNCLKLRESTYP